MTKEYKYDKLSIIITVRIIINTNKEEFKLNEINETKNYKGENKIIYAVNILLSVFTIILPFLKWIKIPVVAGLYSLFGMKESTSYYSLFGYIFAGSNYQSDTIFYVTMLLALISILGIIFLVIYIVKTINNSKKRYRYGFIGTLILNIVSVLFILVVGLTSAILKVIELTYVPYITLFVTIVNMVLIKKIKKNI